MGFKVWGVLVVVVFCALVCNVLGSGDAGAMDDGSERYGSNRYDMGMMEDVGEGEGGGEGFVGGGKGFMLGERLHLINYVFASLKRYSLDLYQAVDWGKLSHEDRLEILAKVRDLWRISCGWVTSRTDDLSIHFGRQLKNMECEGWFLPRPFCSFDFR